MENGNHHLSQPPAATKPSRFNRICVFCGSSAGKNPSYQLAALHLANQLVERNIDLVYGGGSIGLMGLVSQAVHNGGRHVLGYHSLFSLEPCYTYTKNCTSFLTGETIGEVRAVTGMHQRKAEMAKQADAFIALPDKAVDEGFIHPSARHIIVSAPTAHELISKLEDYVPKHNEAAPKLRWEMEQQLASQQPNLKLHVN
ncbi:hypothetical protein DM860_006504 [Cuscuta australis]|uniref:cytokinin riboside 5'-monophosphate phosphoribohydrolase n=1 Tax=Cuscuta australis TaxID=267555 RepID=A0A328D4V2_9ASTE|nr:hypothetical protein DM860_006504 [Cuscuta australis]